MASSGLQSREFVPSQMHSPPSFIPHFHQLPTFPLCPSCLPTRWYLSPEVYLKCSGVSKPTLQRPLRLESTTSSGGPSHRAVAGVSLSQETVMPLHSHSSLEFMINHCTHRRQDLLPSATLSFYTGECESTAIPP